MDGGEFAQVLMGLPGVTAAARGPRRRRERVDHPSVPWFRPQERTQASRISSITGLDASSLEALGGSCLGGSRPCRGQGPDDGPAFDPVLLLDRTA